MVRIQILGGPEAGRVAELGPGRHVCGRHPSADLRIQADTVSGRHLELQITDQGSVRFKDLGSTNGTWAGGMKVTEGEWFSGSELRLGNLKVKLLAEEDIVLLDEDSSGGAGDPTAAAEPQLAGAGSEDAAIHARAVQEAMSGKRRSGLGMIALLVIVVGAAAGGTWWFLNKEEAPETTAGTSPSAAGGPVTQVADLIDNHGAFSEDSQALWSLSSGLSFSGNCLVVGKGNRQQASLAPSFPMEESGLEFSAQVQGDLQAVAAVSWGQDDQEQALGTWCSEPLGSGPAVLALPEQADWFQLRLWFEGEGSLQSLKVVESEAKPQENSSGSRRTVQFGGNLRYQLRDQWLVEVRGFGATWQAGEDGLSFQNQGGDQAWLEVQASEAMIASGPFLVLGEGGPSVPSPGLQVENSPGLLLGGQGLRLELRGDSTLRVRGADRSVRLSDLGQLHLRWNLNHALEQAATLALRIESAARSGDHATLLQATSDLLRDWPLKEEEVEKALDFRRQIMVEGRQRLKDLQVEMSEALFLESVLDMRRVEKAARSLAASYPQTDIEPAALEVAELLNQNAEQVEASRRDQQGAYLQSLQAALAKAYPLLAAFLEERS
ncbi:MAG: FHA domain-containing protein [Planctomycetota bacterium]|nr:MAG: FHA domain-containing protein [Planctomycetota bacterium]